jgi:hypothetical protein
MKLAKAWFVGWILFASLGLAAACGGKASVDGTDSHTHWLRDCQADDECGDLSCICGVCTKACDEGADCAPFGAETTCEVPVGCSARGPTACLAKSQNGGLGGAGAAGASSEPGGSGAQGGNGSAAGAPDCAAMDARVDPDPVCKRFLEAYAWDGTQCQRIPCGCQGSECGALFPSADACDHAYRACYAEHGVSRACAVHADCVIQSRSCCQSCAPVDDPGQILMATAATAPTLGDAGICVGDPQGGCDPCAPYEYSSVYSACVAGECRLLDLSDRATCQTAADCRLVTKDCCDCGGDFSVFGLAAVDASFVRPDYCPTNPTCAECAGGSTDNARAQCRDGICEVSRL